MEHTQPKKNRSLLVLLIMSVFILLGCIFTVVVLHDLSIFPFDKTALNGSRFYPGSYYKDRYGNLFYGYSELFMVYNPLPVDKSTFTPINSYYAKDKDHVYYGETVLEGADLATFTSVPKSENFYQHITNPFGPAASPANDHLYIPLTSVNKVLSNHQEEEFAMDKNTIYLRGEKVAENRFTQIHTVAPDVAIADNTMMFENLYSDGLDKTISFPDKIDLTNFKLYSNEFWNINKKVYCYLGNSSEQYMELKDVTADKFQYYENKKANDQGEPIIFGDGTVFYQDDSTGNCVKTTL